MRLILEGLRHSYGDLVVLEDISLEVAAGERLVLVGPSGCGKSTLLAIIGGLLRPSAGRVLLEGEPPPGCLNPIAFVFQDFALLPWRTVMGNVALALEGRLGRRERRRRVAAVVEKMGLAAFGHAYPAQLSGGMRQRVGIARALAVRPAILLMDEPLSALDAQTRELLMEEFVALWRRERTTTVYVTHNLDEALRLADRICVFSRRPGRIQDVITVELPLEARTDPAHAAHLLELRRRIWAILAEQVRAADRELGAAGGR